MNKISFLFIVLSTAMVSCSNNGKSDAFGNFEAIEVVVSAEQNGKVMDLNISEGVALDSGIVVGYIDTLQLFLQKRSLLSQIEAINARMPEVMTQIQVLDEQLFTANRELKRVQALVEAEAATTKELDNINAQIALLTKQRAATLSNLNTQTKSLLAEAGPLKAQIDLVNLYIQKSKIVNPIKGTVLSKYVEKTEFANIGKPLYKVADLRDIYLKAYIAEDQLSEIKLNQKVVVLIDTPNNLYKEYEGYISSISEKSEFTPKTVQTKDERVNMVYAVKIKVQNDEAIKIGMPGEVRFK